MERPISRDGSEEEIAQQQRALSFASTSAPAAISGPSILLAAPSSSAAICSGVLLSSRMPVAFLGLAPAPSRRETSSGRRLDTAVMSGVKFC